MTDQLEDGVYIGLEAEDYFNQKTMGSTDWGKIDKVKHGWWWSSRHNPRRKPPSDTDPARNYGSALHAIMLEGVRTYEGRWVVAPSKGDFPPTSDEDFGLCETAGQMKAALTRAGIDLAGTSKYAAGDWAAAMDRYLPARPCWPNIMEDFRARSGIRPTISSDEDWSLRFMQNMAIDPDRSDNHAIRKLLTPQIDHPPLAEVSVFAIIDGIRRRWRFDRLFPGAIMDLKSLSGWKGRPLEFEAGEIGARNSWLLQRADYEIGREVMREHIRAGRLFGGDLDQRHYIQEIAEQDDWYWLWVAYQKPDGSGTAPILLPIHDRRGSELHDAGFFRLMKAINFYRKAVAEFGLDKPWGRVEPLHYTEARTVNGIALPQVHFPHWVAQGSEEQES